MQKEQKEEPPRVTVHRVELSLRSIAWILATLVSVWLVLQLRPIILLFVVALVFAGTFNPVVTWIEARGLSRGASLAVLFLGLVLTASLLIFLTVPPLLEQLAGMVADAPGHRDRVIALLEGHGVTAPLARAVGRTSLAEASARIETALLASWPTVLKSMGWTLTTLFLTLYLLADGKRTQGVLYAVVPRDYHMRVARILQKLGVIVGGYMRGQLVTSVAMGLFTFTLLSLCRVPDALSLSLLAAVTDVIPFIGGMIATVPAVLAALGQGPVVALIVLVGLLLYQEVESRALVPRVYGRVLRLSPTVVMLALLSGGILLGVIGAFLALPVAAGLQMVVAELRFDLPGDDSENPGEDVRNAQTEATYAWLSAGFAAPEAGEIAKNLEQDIREGDSRKPASALKL
jgi:predicted PurR-regulated permease PerM